MYLSSLLPLSLPPLQLHPFTISLRQYNASKPQGKRGKLMYIYSVHLSEELVSGLYDGSSCRISLISEIFSCFGSHWGKFNILKIKSRDFALNVVETMKLQTDQQIKLETHTNKWNAKAYNCGLKSLMILSCMFKKIQPWLKKLVKISSGFF